MENESFRLNVGYFIKRAMAAGAGLLGIVLLSGSMLLLSTPGRSLAQEPTTSDSQQDDMPVQEHTALIATDQATQRLGGVMAEVAPRTRRPQQ